VKWRGAVYIQFGLRGIYPRTNVEFEQQGDHMRFAGLPEAV
jgi:hypothetical protein